MDLILESIQIVGALIPFEIKIILMGGLLSIIYFKITETKKED